MHGTKSSKTSEGARCEGRHVSLPHPAATGREETITDLPAGEESRWGLTPAGEAYLAARDAAREGA